MGCCGDANDEDTEQLKGGEELLDQERSCTDPLMLLIFVLFCCGGVVVVAFAFANGDLNRVFYGTDWSGQTCGSEIGKHQFWPNPVFFATLGSVCLESCPGSEFAWTSANPNASSLPMICHCNPQLVSGMNQARNSMIGGESYDFSTLFQTTNLTGTPSVIASRCAAAGKAGFALFGPDEVRNSTAAGGNLVSLSWRSRYGGLNGFDGSPYSYSPAYLGYNRYSQSLPAGVTKFMKPVCNYLYSSLEVTNRCIPPVLSPDAGPNRGNEPVHSGPIRCNGAPKLSMRLHGWLRF